MEKIKEMVDFWTGSKRYLALNNGDYVITFLQQCGQWIAMTGSTYSTRGMQDYFEEKEGWYKMNGTDGIKIIYHEYPEYQIPDFEVKSI